MITRKSRQRKRIALSSMGILVAIIFVSIAHAQQPVDITDVWLAKANVLSESKELVLLSSEVWGITSSDNKIFDNMTSHCVAMRKVVDGKPQKSLLYSKFMDNDGDYFLLETVGEEAPQGTWTFLGGTGKWKGIKGGGKAWWTARVKSQMPDAMQGRLRMTGTFELPK
jgi:hypothetical protein